MSSIFYRIYRFFRSSKWILVLVLLLILLFGGYSISKLQLEEDISKIIPKDQQISDIEDLLSSSRFSNLITLHLYYKDSDTVQGSPEYLITTAENLRDSLIALKPHLISNVVLDYPDTLVESYYNLFYKYLPIYLDEEDYKTVKKRISEEGLQQAMQKNYRALVSPLGIATKKMIARDPLSLTGLAMEKLRKFQPDQNLSLYQNHLLTADKKHLIFFIELANAANETAKNEAVVDKLVELQDIVSQKDASLRFEYFGTGAISVANAKRIKKDIMITVSLAMLLLFFVISFFYRRAAVFFIVVLPGIFGGLVALTVLTYITDSVSSIALGVGSVLLGITVDYALHMFTHFKHQRDIRTLFDDLTSPVLMSSATTACAFFALLFIRSEALRELGIFAGISVISAALFSLIVLPHFLRHDSDEKKTYKENAVERSINYIASIPLHKKTWLMLVLLIITIFSFFTWQNVSFEKDAMQLNYMSDDLKAYEKNLNEVSGIAAKRIYVVSSGRDMWEALQHNTTITDKLEALEKDSIILEYTFLNSLIPDTATQRQHFDRWKAFWEQNGKEEFLENLNAAASSAGFKPETFREFTAKIDQPHHPLSNTDISELLNTIGKEYIIRSDDKFSVINTVKLPTENKERAFAELSSLDKVSVLDKAYVTSKLLTLLSEDFSKLINISLAFVFIFILIAYGRIELAFITFLPILISWLWTLGLMFLFDLSFNIVNIIICTFIFGLGIDYSIFVMRGLTQKFKTGAENLISYKKSILLSAITTLSGIGVLIFAQHPALKSIASLAVFGILSSILITSTFEIVLYNFLIQNRKNRGLVPFTFSTLFLTIFAFVYFLAGCILLYPIMVFLRVPFAGIEKRKYWFHRIMMIFSKSLIYIMANVKKQFVNKHKVDFSKSSVIIANHHSFLDIMLLLTINPKIVMVTNNWVYNSPFFGKSVQFADFILAEQGVVNQVDHVNRLIREGYSIMVFPEGTRSRTANLGRFHKGAFFLAEQFNLDIQPVLLHGTSFTMRKGDDFYLKNGDVCVEFLPRIKADDPAWGNGYSERTKVIAKYFKEKYSALRKKRETPGYFKEIIIKNYIYKGPVLEWYVKIKFKWERGYKTLHTLIPADASVVDIGCGYGYTALALALSSEERTLLGIDYDERKIEIAENVPELPANVKFKCGDAMDFNFPNADVFIMSDLLHYLLPAEQYDLIEKVVAKLNPLGKIIVREGDSNRQTRHRGTVFTEMISTGLGFNRTRNELYFISEDSAREIAKKLQLHLEVIDDTKYTSNVIFIFSKTAHGKV